MKAIVTLQNPDGSYDEVGMNNRILLSGSETSIRNNAKDYANGRKYRIQWFHNNKFYSEPFKTEYFG